MVKKSLKVKKRKTCVWGGGGRARTTLGYSYLFRSLREEYEMYLSGSISVGNEDTYPYTGHGHFVYVT